jgi:hypothetical protein
MCFFALWKAATEPSKPISQIIKLDASGNATRWQGYVALDGFGITRIRNQMSANKPVTGKRNRNQQGLLEFFEGFFVSGQIRLTSGGQVESSFFLFAGCILSTLFFHTNC